ncbi:hypothetical protein BOTBODRAFT_59498 [Botryobasidium botryosum FD-172 SS1]|uniref:Uncharacterized protein n=1 Tax=Botryobasidium botryosum (strain FD-172 SS1) TaxID=930990 RepID=A0A067M8E6_BOTB1|nr:hypothetical protein BOTBODRAFT_59498 [Botryobasidium botryosum FD-172 SS1]
MFKRRAACVGNDVYAAAQYGSRALRLDSASSSAEPSPRALELGLSGGKYEEMSVNEIADSKGESSPGLLSFIYAYFDTLSLEKSEMESPNKYLDL